MGTTVATNALLERKGERHALVTVRSHIGFLAREEALMLSLSPRQKVLEMLSRLAIRLGLSYLIWLLKSLMSSTRKSLRWTNGS